MSLPIDKDHGSQANDFYSDLGGALKFHSQGITLDGNIYGINAEGYRSINNALVRQFFRAKPTYPDETAFSRELSRIFVPQIKTAQNVARRYMLLFDQCGTDKNERVLRRFAQGIRHHQIMIVNRSFLHRLMRSESLMEKKSLKIIREWCILENPKRDLIYLLPRSNTHFKDQFHASVFIGGHGNTLKKVKGTTTFRPRMATLWPYQVRLLLLHFDTMDFDCVACTSCSSGNSTLWEVINEPKPLKIGFPVVVHSITDLKTAFSLEINLNNYFRVLEQYLTHDDKKLLHLFGRMVVRRNRLFEEPVIWKSGSPPRLINPLHRLCCVEECKATVKSSRRAVCLYLKNCPGTLILRQKKQIIPRLLSMTPRESVHVIRHLVYENVSIVNAIRVGLSSPHLICRKRSMHYVNFKGAFPYLQAFFLRYLTCSDGDLEHVVVVPPYKDPVKRVVIGNFFICRDAFGWRMTSSVLPENGVKETHSRFLSEPEAILAIYAVLIPMLDQVDSRLLTEIFWDGFPPGIAKDVHDYLFEHKFPESIFKNEEEKEMWLVLALKCNDRTLLKAIINNNR